jgi:hypothetical protein
MKRRREAAVPAAVVAEAVVAANAAVDATAKTTRLFFAAIK